MTTIRNRSPSPSSLQDRSKGVMDQNEALLEFLTMITLQMENLNICEKEMQELFLPSDLTKQGEYFISVREAVSVLQNELNLNVGRPEELLLLSEYANSNGEINAMLLLEDLGAWVGDYYETSGTSLLNGSASPSASQARPTDSPISAQQMGERIKLSSSPTRDSVSLSPRRDKYIYSNESSPKESK